MDQGRRQIESHLLDKQRSIQTTSHVFWTMQLARNIPKNDEQYIQGITPQRGTSKLHGQFCHTSKDKERTRRKNNLILEDSRETQLVFQTIKI